VADRGGAGVPSPGDRLWGRFVGVLASRRGSGL